MDFGGDASGAAGVNLTGFGAEFLQKIGVEVMNSFCGNIQPPSRHSTIRPTEIDGSLFVFRAHFSENLSFLAMQSAALQVGVEFDFFQSPRRPQTLFVPRCDIDRGAGLFFLGLGAL